MYILTPDNHLYLDTIWMDNGYAVQLNT